MRLKISAIFILIGAGLSACGAADDCGGAAATFGLGAESGRTNFTLVDDCGSGNSAPQKETCDLLNPDAPACD